MDKNLRQSDTGLLFRLKRRLKTFGRLYCFLVRVASPVHVSGRFNRYCRNVLARYPKGSVIVNLGSGPQILCNRPDIINMDREVYKEVDLAGDACALPIQSKSVDLIFNLALVEHVPDSGSMLAEMHRILRPGGTVICFAPFLVPFHAAPDDFYRWTRNGLFRLFSGFDNVTVQVAAGPTSALLWTFQEWIATALSFGSRNVHDGIFLSVMCLTFPLKYLDMVLDKFEMSSNLAAGFFVAASKNG